ncbi:RNA polymerase subunit sigma-24 [Streptomyces albus subsp. albus]|nr:RNA polymerase subunit sigma-24 [Streptomyces albus subsp. albus]
MPHIRWDGPVTSTDALTDVFQEHRPTLLGVAYRMLGGVADAEDIVQETWLRWSESDPRGVRDPRGYLVRITTRLAIDRLRLARTHRESYTGPWLPEPLVTDFDATAPDTAERAVLADTVSFAVLVVLESLSPLERAVFVLREAFGFPYGEIAAALDRTEAAVRQLAGRARRHVAERKPRYAVDPAQQRELTERFIAAAAGGDLARLLDLLAPDVRLVGDGGGRAQAPVRVLETADRVGRFLAGAADRLPGAELRLLELNGRLGALVLLAGKPEMAFGLDVADGAIQCVYVVRNPEKLAGLAGVVG